MAVKTRPSRFSRILRAARAARIFKLPLTVKDDVFDLLDDRLSYAHSRSGRNTRASNYWKIIQFLSRLELSTLERCASVDFLRYIIN